MSEDERLAWARLVSGRAVESHRLWRRYYDDPSSLTDEERSDGALQCSLVRVLWHGTAACALAAIGYLGDTFTAESPVAAVDALGLVMCHVAALAEISELTMLAVIGLALQRIIDGEVPLLPSSDLARSLGRGRVDFSASVRSKANNCARFDALAGVVARAIDDVHISYGVEVKPMDLYRRIADEVIAGRMPVQPERDPLELRYSLERQPEPAPRVEFDRRTQAFGQLADAVQSIYGPLRMERYPELDGRPPGIAAALGAPILPPGLSGEAMAAQAREADGALRRLMESEFAAAHDHADAKERELWEHGYGGRAPVDPAQIVGLTGFDRALDGVRQAMQDDILSHLRSPVPGLAIGRICPQCAGLLSERGDGMLACPNLHEFTADQLQAIAAASTAGDPTG